MATVNKVILVGNLGRDPEIHHATSGIVVATLNLATTEKFKARNGEQQEQTEWHRIVIFGKQAEIAQRYLNKGSLVCIEGRLQTRKWQDKTGVNRYTTEIACDRLMMLGLSKAADARDAVAKPAVGESDDWEVPWYADPQSSPHSTVWDDPPF